jgi:hypothetical protein
VPNIANLQAAVNGMTADGIIIAQRVQMYRLLPRYTKNLLLFDPQSEDNHSGPPSVSLVTVASLYQTPSQFDQPSTDNLADWEKIVCPLTVEFPIYVSLLELWDFFEENR